MDYIRCIIMDLFRNSLYKTATTWRSSQRLYTGVSTTTGFTYLLSGTYTPRSWTSLQELIQVKTKVIATECIGSLGTQHTEQTNARRERVWYYGKEVFTGSHLSATLTVIRSWWSIGVSLNICSIRYKNNRYKNNKYKYLFQDKRNKRIHASLR